MKRNLSHFLVSSNAFFLLPFLLSLYLGIYLHAFSIFVCIIGSVLYHQSGETKMHLTDRYSAIQLILVNVILLTLGGLKQDYLLIIILLIATAFYFKWLAEHRNYSMWHSMWHVMSACITIASILSYKSF